jgi:D-alanyl-D-alanine carboxypeptidase/D-alanyl-D-alanine-endopeptidase (penicillin-binding protein 4)
LAAVAVAVVALTGGNAAPATVPTGALATPLWSPRRVPAPVVDVVGAQHLQLALDATLGASSGCFVVHVGGAVVASRNPQTPLLGASTAKLLTAAATLNALGPNFRFETRAVATSAPTGGSLDKLWLVGAGDPVLATADYATFLESKVETRGTVVTRLETLADGIVAAGVRRISGGVAGDESRYDNQRYLPSWKEVYRTDGTIGPLGALTVNDGFRAWTPNKVAVDDPALYAAQELTQLLRARGVDVGTATRGTMPAGARTIATLASPPLSDVVASMLQDSDNLSAELLTKELAVHAGGPGTTATGVAAIAAQLRVLGVPTGGLVLVDGSGLDRGNRLSCAALDAALTLASRTRFRALSDGLPVAGRSGTLGDRLVGTVLDGRLHAKTGSLDGVTGLAGSLDHSPPIRFTFVDNGSFSEGAGITLRERFAATLAGYPDAPSGDALVPAPASRRVTTASR